MLFPAGLAKQIYVDRSQAACGGPGWVIRVTLGGAVQTYAARAWRVRGGGQLEGRGGLDELLTPMGPAYWVETTAEVEIVGAAIVRA